MNQEKKIELEIKNYLTKTGWFVFKISQPRKYSKNIPGIADLYAIKHGKSVWIEVKTEKGIISDSQENFAYEIYSHGGNYHLAKSVNDVECLNARE